MLDLNLVPKHGNAGGRFFPHSGKSPSSWALIDLPPLLIPSGHLGVSSVTVSGTIIAKLLELCQPLPVKSVTLNVRCYETRSGGPFRQTTESVLWEKAKRIWESPEDEYYDMGDWECPFSISIPADAVPQACSTQWLKDWKVVWRMEVAIEHKPIAFVGHRITKAYALNLVNYRTPALPLLSPPSPIPAPGAQIHVCPPHGAFGPGDTFGISVHVRPDEPASVVKKAVMVLERTIEFLEGVPAREPSPDFAPHSPSPSRLSSLWRRSVSPRPPVQAPDPPSPEPDTTRTIVHKVCEATCEEPLVGAGGVVSCAGSFTLPKRGGNWDTGETVRSGLVVVSFAIKVKVSLKRGKDFTCPPVPVSLLATSSTERAQVQATRAVMTPPKRRHRSSRRGLYMQEGTIDIDDPVVKSPRRRRTRAQSASPVVPSVAGVATSVKPILLPPDHPAQAHSISFVFPSPPPGGSASLDKLPFIATMLHTPPESTDPTLEPIDYESLSILRQFQHTGRRISTTTSEEEEMQPSRSRPKLQIAADYTQSTRPSLPSLDALGLGLPHIPDEDRPSRRPRTAPMHSSFAARIVPPPLSGGVSFGDHLRPTTSGGFGHTPSQGAGAGSVAGTGSGAFAFQLPGGS